MLRPLCSNIKVNVPILNDVGTKYKTCLHHGIFATFLILASFSKLSFFLFFLFFFFFCQWSENEMLISVNQNGAQDHVFNNSLSSYNIYFKLLGISYKANHSLAPTHYFNRIFLLHQKSTVLHITFVPPIPNISSDNK